MPARMKMEQIAATRPFVFLCPQTNRKPMARSTEYIMASIMNLSLQSEILKFTPKTLHVKNGKKDATNVNKIEAIEMIRPTVHAVFGFSLLWRACPHIGQLYIGDPT